LFVLNAGLVVVVLGLAHAQGMTLGHTLPLVLTILLASIPVALPATFTLAAALGSVELSKFGVFGDAAQRLARYRLDDGAVQRQNRHPYAQ
jgi:magnesium-transporting ATPase (P-type)